MLKSSSCFINGCSCCCFRCSDGSVIHCISCAFTFLVVSVIAVAVFGFNVDSGDGNSGRIVVIVIVSVCVSNDTGNKSSINDS